MSSKAIKPKQRIGNLGTPVWKKALLWSLLVLTLGGGYWYARSTGVLGPKQVEIPTARVRRGEFIQAVRTRGEIKSSRSITVSAPQVPDLTIVKLAPSGKPIKRGEIVVEFDAADLEQRMLENTTSLRAVDSEIVQTKAQHKIVDERDGMTHMQSGYNVERAKLEASKAEILSEIEGAKNRINVGITEGEKQQVEVQMKAHQVSQNADLERLNEKKDKGARDLERTRGYLRTMSLRAPNDGIVNVLPNFRSGGSWGRMPPPFKEGDKAWTGAAIAEIPDLSEMRMELQLDEVDRGRLQLGQTIHIRVDAIPDKEFVAELSYISPVAEMIYKGFRMTQKVFPAHGQLQNLDPRLRPGMSATADVVIDRKENALLIPARASFLHEGKPAVWVATGGKFEIRQIEVGERNDESVVVLSGLKENEVIALEDPKQAARKAESD